MEEERVILSETEIMDCLARFPSLSRNEIVYAIVRAGPWRPEVEKALEGMAAVAKSVARGQRRPSAGDS
jgi:hypothetical protein